MRLRISNPFAAQLQPDVYVLLATDTSMHLDQTLMHLSPHPPVLGIARVHKPLRKTLNDSTGMAKSVTWYASTVFGGEPNSSTVVCLSRRPCVHKRFTNRLDVCRLCRRYRCNAAVVTCLESGLLVLTMNHGRIGLCTCGRLSPT